MEGAPAELWRFACEGFLGNLTREHQARMAKVEAELEATVDGETHPYRMLRVVMSNEPDRDKRAAARGDAPAAARRAPEPGLPRRGRDRPRGRAPARLAELLRALQALRLPPRRARATNAAPCSTTPRSSGSARATASSARGSASALATRARGTSRGSSGRRSSTSCTRRIACCPALEATLTDLGVDLRSQENVHLDLESRPSKTPRAFCAPIEVPGKVMLVIQPIGGKDDWEALFHEAGHTEHYAHTSDDLPMEAKRLGDMAVTEGWAMLLQHLVTEPAWLNRRLDVPRPADLAHDGAVSLLYFVRRYARQAHLRDRVLPGGGRRSRCAALRRDPRRRAEAAGRTRRATSTTSTAASTSPATCARGRSRRSCASSCAASSGTTGSPSATPATCCASSGRSGRARPRTSC